LSGNNLTTNLTHDISNTTWWHQPSRRTFHLNKIFFYFSVFFCLVRCFGKCCLIARSTLYNRPASWSSGQSYLLLIMRSRVRFPALPWGFFLEGEDSHGDHGLGSLVELRLRPLLVLHIHIPPSTSSEQRSCLRTTSLDTTRPSTIFYRLLLNWASLRRH
jgi:hypothetical protein